MRFVFFLPFLIPSLAMAGGSCNEAVSAAVSDGARGQLYLGLTRGAVSQVDLETLAVTRLHDPAGTYYNCIYDMHLVSDGQALFVETSADLGFVLQPNTGQIQSFSGVDHGTTRPEAAWNFRKIGQWRDDHDALWFAGFQPGNRDGGWDGLYDLSICRAAGDGLRCRSTTDASWLEGREPVRARILHNELVEIAAGRRHDQPQDGPLVEFPDPRLTHDDLIYVAVDPTTLAVDRIETYQSIWCAEWPGKPYCGLGAEEKWGELVRFDSGIFVESTDDPYVYGGQRFRTIFDRDFQVTLTDLGALAFLVRGQDWPRDLRMVQLTPAKKTQDYWSLEVESMLPFSSVSGTPDGTLLVGEGDGIIHLIDLRAKTRRSLACGYAAEPRDFCQVLFSGELEPELNPDP